MGIVAQRLQEQRAVSSSIGHPRDSIIAEYYGGYPSSSGVTVSEWTAMNFSAVYRAISIIAGSVSTLPFNLYRTEECDFSDPVLGHPVHQLLNVSPNPEMDAASWREANTGHALSWGNGYSEIELNGAGKPKYAWPIRPDRVTPDRVPSGEVVYRIARPNGGTDTLPASQMIHVHGLSYDGLMGYAVIRLAREAIGMGLATEQFGATFFGNGARPGGILVSPKSLSDVAAENLRRSWNNLHQGPQNANKTAILEEGTTWQQTGLPNEDGMFLQTRAFQIKEIARWFGVPPHLLGDLDRATFSNIEQQSLEFVLYCLRYWFKRWEAACFSKLLDADEQQQFLLQHDADDLIRADGKTRAEADRVDVDSGVKSVNEVRRDRKLAPIGPAGDIYRMPLNMADAKKVSQDQLVDPKQAATDAAAGESSDAGTETEHADPEAAASAADLQGTALNGAQITALLQITEQVANGDLSPEAAQNLILLSFPLMGEAQVNALIKAIEIKEKDDAASTGEADLKPAMSNPESAVSEPKPIETVASTSLKRSQVVALLQITNRVFNGKLTRPAARAVAELSFPQLPSDKLAVLLDAVEVRVPQELDTPRANLSGDAIHIQKMQQIEKDRRVRGKVQAGIEAVIKRMTLQEVRAAIEAARKPERFSDWLDDYYPAFEIRCREAITEHIAALLEIDGRDVTPEAAAFEISSKLISEHRNQLLETSGHAHTADELVEAIKRLSKDWSAISHIPAAAA